MQLQSMNELCNMNFSNSLTVVIPVRIDSKERANNIRTVLRLVCEFGHKAIVLEADRKSILRNKNWWNAEFAKKVEYQFLFDVSPVFYRTRYINKLLREATTDTVAIWDADILISHNQLLEGLNLINQGCTIAYPYNGEYVMLSDTISHTIRQTLDIEFLNEKELAPIFSRKFCGGIFLVNRRQYLLCGGENERFTGWGPEDTERLHRVRILGYCAGWLQRGKAYHLFHPRGKNSNFHTKEDAIKMRKELLKVCSMNKEELNKYIQTWEWLQKI